MKPDVTTDNSNQASTASMQLSELWRYKLLVPAVAILVTGIVAFWVVRQPKVYEATATLEYDINPSKPLGSIDDGQSGYNFWDTQEFYETQNYILRSRAIADRVVRRLSLHTDPGFVGTSKDNPKKARAASVVDAASMLQGRITVEQIRDTRVVAVRVRDQDPARAQLIANTLLDTYIDKSLEDHLGTSVNALEWLTGQLTNLKRDLESAELALYKFREENHSLSASLEERQKLIAGQLQNYSNAITTVHAKKLETDARLKVLRESIAAEYDIMAVRTGPLQDDSLIEGLREQYRTQEADLLKLMQTYGEAHPQVRAGRVNLESIKQQLRNQVNAIVASVESEARQLEQAEVGLRSAFEQINKEGLALSLQEISYSRLDRERESKAHLYETLLNRAAETDLARALRVARARIIDRAVKPENAVSPRVRFTIILGILAGLAAGVAAAFAAARLDNKVRGAADIEARGITVLGVLPAVESGRAAVNRRHARGQGRVEDAERDLVVHLQPKSAVAECSRTIRTNITFQSADKALRTLAVTSAMPREGKTTVSVSLAITMAQSGRKVLLVDTDLRKPRLHRVFGLPAGFGITSILAGEATLAEAAVSTEVVNLSLLPCGPLPPNPSELLHTRRFSELIQEMQQSYDLVVFDSPPLGAVTDPAIIATQVDGTVLVARSRSTTRVNVQSALRQLRGVGARLIGAVLNGVDLNSSEYGSYSGYYRGYYAEESSLDAKPTSARS